MSSLFRHYRLAAESGLFDRDFYLARYPEVRALNVDPLTHYLEQGAAAGFEPSAAFDTPFYLEQCRAVGETPDNPLLHFIVLGAARGLSTRPPPAAAPEAAPATPILVGLDGVRLLRDPASGRSRLAGQGWAVSGEPIAEVTVAVAGGPAVLAAYGLLRPDVRERHPGFERADHSGFSFSIDAVPDGIGPRAELAITVRTERGTERCHRIAADLPPVAEPALAAAGRQPPPMQLYVDQAAVDGEGLLHLVGWAVSLAPVAAVQVHIDGEPLGLAEHGKRRDDVADARPDYPEARHAGFLLRADLRRFGAGRHALVVRAVALGGLSRELRLPLEIPAIRPAAAPPDAETRLQCDELSITTAGQVDVAGWALAPGGIDSLELRLDDAVLGLAEVGLPRPDVGNHFPAHPQARQSGFAFRRRLGPLPEGEHLLLLRLQGAGGEQELRLPVRVVADGAEPPAPETPAYALEEHLKLFVDTPALRGGAAAEPVRGNLVLNGWALADEGVERVEIAIDDGPASPAYYGVRREDIEAAFPDRPGALLSGFAAVIPGRVIGLGAHRVRVTLHDKGGHSAEVAFSVEIAALPEQAGPWSLRRKMPQAEIDLGRRALEALGGVRALRLLLPVGRSEAEIARARATLASLRHQALPAWRLLVLPRPGAPRAGLRDRLLEDADDLADRVELVAGGSGRRLADLAAEDDLVGILAPGDELGCDALLELALGAAETPEAELIYADDRRWSPAADAEDAFFKPDWSPDLLLSTNYLGRSWVARHALLARCGGTLAELLSRGGYDLALRCTEAARQIHHVPKVLLRLDRHGDDGAAREQAALEAALARRSERAVVEAGAAPGTHRVRRARRTTGRVSIIIPTCAARGLVETCLETLRARTRYRNFEIVCIENIPAPEARWRDWLQRHADRVVSTTERFNWSRFNNLAAAEASGEHLLFLNDDIEIVDPDWLDVLLAEVERPEVGAVGPQLLYPDGRVQHAGLFLTHLGKARHAFRFAAADEPGPFGLALAQRNVIGVTGACLLTRRDSFEKVGRFDEAHSVVNNDLDYCLRLWRAGLLNVFTPHTRLIHHELASRSVITDDYDASGFEGTWRSLFHRGDPYFHPDLSRDGDDYSPEREPLQLVHAGHPLFAREAVRRILAVKVDHIGDCITALPALRRLRELFPTARLSVLTGRSSRAVWADEPGIDEIVEFDFFAARSGLGARTLSDADWQQLEARLLPRRFDLAIDLRKHPDTREVLRHTGARWLAGFDHRGQMPWLDVALEWEGDPKFAAKRRHVADDLVCLVEAVGAATVEQRGILPPPARTAAVLASPFARRFFGRRVVCVHPASGTELRQWPAGHFAELIDLLVESEDVNVVVIGGPDEQAVADGVLGAVRHRRRVWSLLGKVALAELPSVLARCSLYVGNNSGPKHIAAALGVPTLGIHSGVIDSNEWGPLGPNAVALRREMTCAPCYVARLEDCQRGLACLRRLSPGEVLRACRRLLPLANGAADRTAGKHALTVGPDNGAGWPGRAPAENRGRMTP